MTRRHPKGSPQGGRFAPETRGKTPPSAAPTLPTGGTTGFALPHVDRTLALTRVQTGHGSRYEPAPDVISVGEMETYPAELLLIATNPSSPGRREYGLRARVHGEDTTVALTGFEYEVLAERGYDLRWSSALYTLRYANTVRPDLFAGLKPGLSDPNRGPFSMAASLPQISALHVPAAFFPPWVTREDPWRTVVDQPTLEFAPWVVDGEGPHWWWRPRPSDAVTAAVAWHDLAGIARLTELMRDRQQAQAFAWLNRDTREGRPDR